MLETEVKFMKKIYVVSYLMRCFLYQTICRLANITEEFRNYYNKIETVGRGVSSVVIGGSEGLIWVTRNGLRYDRPVTPLRTVQRGT
jgi:hypothetical protein